jgi:hypothetical protein
MVSSRVSSAAKPREVSGVRDAVDAQEEMLDVKVGKQAVLLRSGYEGLRYFPDQPIALLNRRPLTFLTAVGNETVLFSGLNWKSLHPIAKVLQAGDKGSFDNGYAGVGGVFKDGSKVYAFYHAEDQDNLHSEYSKRNNQKAFIASVGCAISDDGGKTFQKIGQVLASGHPRKDGAECSGIGDISICADRTKSYLYAYYTDYSRHGNEGVQICVARSPLESKGRPGSWKKYHDGGFNEPGLSGLESHILSWHSRGGDAYSPSVEYNESLGKYLMVFCVVDYSEIRLGKESKQPKKSGIYLCPSEDGVVWGESIQLFASHALLRAGTRDVVHPTLLIESTKGMDLRGVLVYAFTPKWPDVPHHLAGRTITISPKGRPVGQRDGR